VKRVVVKKIRKRPGCPSVKMTVDADPQDKGDALENAVAAIEEVILQSSAGIGRQPIIEKKKIITVNGVRHEIDVSAGGAPLALETFLGGLPFAVFACLRQAGKGWALLRFFLLSLKPLTCPLAPRARSYQTDPPKKGQSCPPVPLLYQRPVTF
jgi:hypothetical protein